MESLRSYAQVLQGDSNYRPLPVPGLPGAAENGTQVNIALRSGEQSLARGEPREEPNPGYTELYESQFPLLNSDQAQKKRKPTTMKESKRNLTAAPVSSHSLLRRRDSGIAFPTSEPGSPVANDFVPVDQIHRKKPHAPSMENEFASPSRKPRTKARHNEEETPARNDERQETRSKSPSKKVSYNGDRDAKEFLAARNLSGHQ